MSPILPTSNRRVILKVGYACNNACAFCHSSSLLLIGSLDGSQVKRRVVEALEIGADSVLFSGGEPTIRPDLLELVRFTRKQGLGFGFITNGRMLSYQPLTAKLLGLGMDYVYMSLHGPEAVHDSITRAPGSFAQASAALALLSRVGGLELTCNTVVTCENMDCLEQVVDMVLGQDRVVLKFSAVEPKGGAAQDKGQIPHPIQSARAVSRALDYALSRGMSLDRLGVDGFPHCLDSRFAGLQTDFFTHGIMGIREVNEGAFFPIDYGNMSKPAACRGCLLGDPCRGTWSGILDSWGDEFLRPVAGGLSNSFNYHPVPEGVDPPDVRRLAVEEQGQRLELFTDTGDFPEEQIVRVRDELQQVYFQQDDDAFVTDFQRQLFKLKKSGDAFKVVDKDLFGDADRLVRGIVSRVSGRVLDVGCGQTRYGDLLERGLESGRLAYCAVDPAVGEEVLALKGRKGVEVHVSTIEECHLDKDGFDWVLVLRSHNHLGDLWTAYSKLLGALAWGGHLLVVDNVPFGLVRLQVSKEAVEVISEDTRPEHLRNHSLGQCRAFLSRFPLLLEEQHDVTPATANQWVALYRKAWPSGQLGVDTFKAG